MKNYEPKFKRGDVVGREIIGEYGSVFTILSHDPYDQGYEVKYDDGHIVKYFDQWVDESYTLVPGANQRKIVKKALGV